LLRPHLPIRLISTWLPFSVLFSKLRKNQQTQLLSNLLKFRISPQKSLLKLRLLWLKELLLQKLLRLKPRQSLKLKLPLLDRSPLLSKLHQLLLQLLLQFNNKPPFKLRKFNN
jgi:hypothetical protein